MAPGVGTLVINATLAGRLQGRYRCFATNALGTALSLETRVIAESEMGTPNLPDTPRVPPGQPPPPPGPLRIPPRVTRKLPWCPLNHS